LTALAATGWFCVEKFLMALLARWLKSFNHHPPISHKRRRINGALAVAGAG
jgi:hypothetical protein